MKFFYSVFCISFSLFMLFSTVGLHSIVSEAKTIETSTIELDSAIHGFDDGYSINCFKPHYDCQDVRDYGYHRYQQRAYPPRLERSYTKAGVYYKDYSQLIECVCGRQQTITYTIKP